MTLCISWDTRGGKIVEGPEKQADTFRFALELSQALQLQDQGTHIVVSQDESFVNTGICFRSSWFKKGHSLISVTSEGKLFIFTGFLNKTRKVFP